MKRPGTLTRFQMDRWSELQPQRDARADATLAIVSVVLFVIVAILTYCL